MDRPSTPRCGLRTGEHRRALARTQGDQPKTRRRPSFALCRARSIRRSVSTASAAATGGGQRRSEEHTSELQSLMRISYAVFCLKKKKIQEKKTTKKTRTD